MEEYMWIIWLVIFILSLVIESISAELVSIFFTLGSVVALILSLITGIPYYVEVIVFTVLSIVSLIVLRPIMKKVLDRQKRTTNVDELIGKVVKLTEKYTADDAGAAKINGVIWTCVNVNEHEEISEGKEVEIISVKGNKLIVKEK